MTVRRTIVAGAALTGALTILAPAAYGVPAETSERTHRNVPVAATAEHADHSGAPDHQAAPGHEQGMSDRQCRQAGDQAGTPMAQRHDRSHDRTHDQSGAGNGHRMQHGSPDSATQTPHHGDAGHAGGGHGR